MLCYSEECYIMARCAFMSFGKKGQVIIKFKEKNRGETSNGKKNRIRYCKKTGKKAMRMSYQKTKKKVLENAKT
mgnify:CR=1 FL=1